MHNCVFFRPTFVICFKKTSSKNSSMQVEDKETELTLGRLCDVLQLDERFVLNVYQYGSR